MKYIKLSIEDILHKIKIDNDSEYYRELINDEEIKHIINKTINRYSFGSGSFLINREFIKGITESILIEITWRYFKIEKCQKGNISNGYIAFLNKYLGIEVFKQLKLERPHIKEKIVGNSCDLEKFQSIFFSYNDDVETDDDNFEYIINKLNDNQKNVMRKIYKYQYTENELSQESGISQQCIHKTKQRSKNNIRKEKFKTDGC